MHLDKWPMEDRAENLRRRIDMYRCYLSAGADIQIIPLFLGQIAADEVELDAIENRNSNPKHRYQPLTVSSLPFLPALSSSPHGSDHLFSYRGVGPSFLGRRPGLLPVNRIGARCPHLSDHLHGLPGRPIGPWWLHSPLLGWRGY